MKRAFKISTNIERDSSVQIDYIVTKNTNDVLLNEAVSHGDTAFADEEKILTIFNKIMGLHTLLNENFNIEEIFDVEFNQ